MNIGSKITRNCSFDHLMIVRDVTPMKFLEDWISAQHELKLAA
jgi:hypothetical protein